MKTNSCNCLGNRNILAVQACTLSLAFFVFVATDAVAFSNAHFGQGSGTIHLANVACNGVETQILDCPYTTSHGCSHSDDAGVQCKSECMLRI